MDSRAPEALASVNGHLISPALTPTEGVIQDGPVEFPRFEDLHEANGTHKTGRSQTLDPADGAAAYDRSSLKSEADIHPRRLTIDVPPTKALQPGGASRLSAARIQELTSAPGSLPVRRLHSGFQGDEKTQLSAIDGSPEVQVQNANWDILKSDKAHINGLGLQGTRYRERPRPTPVTRRSDYARNLSPSPMLRGDDGNSHDLKARRDSQPRLPIPPFSIPTFLHLELASERPSRLYIDSSSNTLPYEPYQVKLERLLNFLRLPRQLEHVLVFGALCCLDAWLYTFTILPLRFCRALGVLVVWLSANAWFEILDLSTFVYRGAKRFWHRKTKDLSDCIPVPEKATSNIPNGHVPEAPPSEKPDIKERISRRVRSSVSLLQADHKADLLQGLLIITSCVILLRFDASKVYHSIRGQAAIKLYVIYNMLEVCDRLFSALGQDIVECLFSPDTLERHPNGRSKITRPAWLFCLALVYTVIHGAALFYQAITLNVAVNSYSNALLTLLISNQFVEIKGAVFKKIEKENLFQLTCADVVERFQLWLLLFIIAMRNIVEVGGLAAYASDADGSGTMTNGQPHDGTFPRHFSILPDAFRFLPSTFPAQVLVPFMFVIGSEMLVDWLKHAYINKFNAISPQVYGRFLDVLARDYYTNAFRGQSMTRRLGLPIIPLACVFIRATLQTYHMFLAANVAPPLISVATGLSTEADATASPVIAQLDFVFRRALGRSSLGGGASNSSWYAWSLDDALALLTMVVVFAAVYVLLLAFKLLLGMLLLKLARDRLAGVHARERDGVVDVGAKRIGGLSAVEVGEERRQTIYEGDPVGLGAIRKRDARNLEKAAEKTDGLERVDRYRMISKRIW